MICGVKKTNNELCTNNSMTNGVCGIHKKFGYLTDNEQFKQELINYKNIIIEYANACKELEENGYSLLNIQQYCNNNLIDLNKANVPIEYKKVNDLLVSQLDYIEKLKENYDSYLVCNNCTMISHEILNKFCNCTYCILKKNKKLQNIN